MTGLAVDNPKTKAFLKEVQEVCKRHNLSISHEDGQGAFLVEEFSNKVDDWFMSAFDETTKGGAK